MANYSLFIEKAPGIMTDLKRDFGFTTIQTAAILGNIGHECNGFRSMQEIDPSRGRGGYGWCQWTGPRRRAFEAWCRERGLDITSDRANYGFLRHELTSTHRNAVTALKRETELVRAVRVFELKFLIAGVKHYPSRERYAEIALQAYRRTGAAGVSGLETEGVETEEEFLETGLETLDGSASSAIDTGEDEPTAPDWGGSRTAIQGVFGDIFGTELTGGILAAGPPVIHDTASWNARPPKRPITVLNRRPKGIVIHHTASANVQDMSLAHAKRLARSIQGFHMGPQRNWIDTGQHFTVSRGGHILEGRHRSLEVARRGQNHVLGAHADAACNRDYVGIENEGTYTSALPPATQWQALVQLCAWLCDQYGMSTSNIIGHRQCKPTECPGDRFFARLDQLRRDVDRARSGAATLAMTGGEPVEA